MRFKNISCLKYYVVWIYRTKPFHQNQGMYRNYFLETIVIYKINCINLRILETFTLRTTYSLNCTVKSFRLATTVPTTIILHSLWLVSLVKKCFEVSRTRTLRLQTVLPTIYTRHQANMREREKERRCTVQYALSLSTDRRTSYTTTANISLGFILHN